MVCLNSSAISSNPVQPLLFLGLFDLSKMDTMLFFLHKPRYILKYGHFHEFHFRNRQQSSFSVNHKHTLVSKKTLKEDSMNEELPLHIRIG
jgi:hypothetical protein